MTRLILAAAILAALAAGCGGGSGGGGGTTVLPPAPEAWEAVADRLAAVQNPDGSWSAGPSAASPITESPSPEPGVTAVVALALHEANVKKPTASWKTAVDRAAAYLVLLAEDTVAGNYPGLPVSVMLFLEVYRHAYGALIWGTGEFGWTLAQDEAYVVSVHETIMELELAEGTVPTVYMDGLANHIAALRTAEGRPDLAVWDNGFALRYCTRHDGIGVTDRSWFSNYLNDLARVLDPAEPKALAAMAHALSSIRDAGDVPPSGVFLTELLAAADPQGLIVDLQTTAYALTAFKAVGDPQAAPTQAYLESLIGPDGSIEDPSSGEEAHQAEAETLLALIR